jgi:hypothetical protein
MTTRTRIARIAATAAVLLAAPAFAQQPQGIAKDPLVPLKQGTGPIVLKMGNEQGTLQQFTALWSAGKVAADEWDAPAAKLPTKAELATFEFTASTGAPRVFYSWVSAAFSGKNAPQAGEVMRAGGRIQQFSAATVAEVDFPALAAGKLKSQAEFVVRAKGQWSPGEAKISALLPGKAALAVSPAVSGYRLSLGPTVQGAIIEGLEPFTLRPLQAATITLHTRPPVTEALQKLAAPQKVKQPVGAAKVLGGLPGRLELLGADGRTVFATIMLQDVQVEGGSPAKLGVLVKGGPGLVTLTAARAELEFFPMKIQ